MFINDLPQNLGDALHERGIDCTELDPAMLVANDVLGISKDISSLLVILCTCYRWALVSKLRYNPVKSQVLYLGSPESTPADQVPLGSVRLKYVIACRTKTRGSRPPFR